MEGTQRMALSFSVLALGVLIRCALALQQDWRQSIQQVYSVNYPPTSSQAVDEALARIAVGTDPYYDGNREVQVSPFIVWLVSWIQPYILNGKKEKAEFWLGAHIAADCLVALALAWITTAINPQQRSHRIDRLALITKQDRIAIPSTSSIWINGAHVYMPPLVMAVWLFNPYSIGGCLAGSMRSLTYVLPLWTIVALMEGFSTSGILLLAVSGLIHFQFSVVFLPAALVFATNYPESMGWHKFTGLVDAKSTKGVAAKSLNLWDERIRLRKWSVLLSHVMLFLLGSSLCICSAIKTMSLWTVTDGLSYEIGIIKWFQQVAFANYYLLDTTPNAVSWMLLVPFIFHFKERPYVMLCGMVTCFLLFNPSPTLTDYAFALTLWCCNEELWRHTKGYSVLVLFTLATSFLQLSTQWMWLSTLAGNANFYFNQVWLCTVGFGNILIDGIVSAMRIKSAEGLLLEHQPTCSSAR